MGCSASFKEANFGLSFYIRDIDSRWQHKYPLYYMTRDGFTFLVMGFTGKVAAQFKEAYIEAFNEMEKAISTSKEGEYVAKELQKYCVSYSQSVKSIHADCKQRFGFSTSYYGDMPVSLTYHSDWTVQQNLKYILRPCRRVVCSTPTTENRKRAVRVTQDANWRGGQTTSRTSYTAINLKPSFEGFLMSKTHPSSV